MCHFVYCWCISRILQIPQSTRDYIKINSKTMFERWVSTEWTNHTYFSIFSHTRTSGSRSRTHRSGVDCISRGEPTKPKPTYHRETSLLFSSRCRLEFYLQLAFFSLCWFRRTNSTFLCLHRQMFVIRSVDRLPLVLNSFLVRLGTHFFFLSILCNNLHQRSPRDIIYMVLRKSCKHLQ